MNPTKWTDVRLRRLLDRYRVCYWPRSSRLPAFNIQASSLNGPYGRCDFEAKSLHIDVFRHPSDRELRATVLHEMIHAAVGHGGHHAPFWTQLEYLLSRQAPITVSFPELGERGSHLHVIPSRFRRCRRLFRPVYERWQRAIFRMKVDGEQTFTPAEIEQECEDMAVAGSLWRAIWPHQARLYGFVDLDGNVLRWALPYRIAARRGYVRGRRFHLEEEGRRAVTHCQNTATAL